MRSQVCGISVLITALIVGFGATVGVSGTAQAANFTVTSKNRLFCCTNPPVFIAGQPGKVKQKNGMGSYTGSGYQPAVGPYGVTQVGSGVGASIKVGMGEVVNFSSMFSWVKGGMTSPPPGFKYIKGTASFENGAGTLKKNGGFGSFSFCPKAKGPGVGACTNPGSATPASFNGRIYAKPGPNKFGGTLQILAGAGGVGGSKNKIWRWVAPYSMYPALLLDFNLVSSPVGAMTPAKLKTINNLVTMLVTHTAGSMLLTIKNDTDAVLSANGGGPFTTGTVYLGVTANGTPSTRQVTLSGYDKRTAMGAGNVQLVSGLLFNTYQNIKNGSFVTGWKLNLPEPSPSFGLVAGAVALFLLKGVAGKRGRN
jgi:hypothetical protein